MTLTWWLLSCPIRAFAVVTHAAACLPLFNTTKTSSKLNARKLHFIFRWDYFRTPQDALNTACWFATWANLEGDFIQHRVTELFIEATVHDHSRIFRSSPSSILR